MSETSRLIRHPGPGCVVEFMQSNQPVLAYVLEEQSGRLRLLTASKRETNLAASRLLPWSGPAGRENLPKAEIEAILKRHAEHRREIEHQIDPLELWELAQGEVTQARAEWFASMLWQDPDVDQVAAMGHALIARKTHFKFNPPEFEVLEKDKVETRLAEAERARLREKLASEGREYLRRLWDQPEQAGQLDEETAAKLKELLFTRMREPGDAETESLWTELKKGLPDHAHLPLLLAQRWGLVPAHYNYLLDQAGYAWGDGWSAEHMAEVARIKALVGESLPAPEATPFVSIDSATTRDIDDAFVCSELPGGGFAVEVALACPVLGWDFSSELNAAVLDRATSIYLPEGASHMLPETLGTEFFSLKAGEARPSLVLSATVDAEGNVSSEEVRFACVRLAENVCYEAAEARIEAGESLFAAGWRLAQALKNRRLALGAVIIERPEPEIELRQEAGETRVELVLKDEAPKAKLLVSELMILANEAVARFAAAHDLPLLYRTQDVVLPSTFCGVWTEPHEIYRVVKQFGPTLTEVEPRPHRGLGLAAYSSITSPLRRYLDFLNCAQVFSFLTSGQPRAGREELAALLPRLAARNEAAGQIQRFRPRYWKLLYLKQNMARDFPAVVVEDCGNLVSFSLPEVQIFVRAPKDMVGDKVAPGMRFCLRFGRIDPLTNELRVAAVLDEEAARAG